jgi:hypothetical protein
MVRRGCSRIGRFYTIQISSARGNALFCNGLHVPAGERWATRGSFIWLPNNSALDDGPREMMETLSFLVEVPNQQRTLRLYGRRLGERVVRIPVPCSSRHLTGNARGAEVAFPRALSGPSEIRRLDSPSRNGLCCSAWLSLGVTVVPVPASPGRQAVRSDAVGKVQKPCFGPAG